MPGEISGGSVVDVVFEVADGEQEVAFAIGESLIEGSFGRGTWATTLRISGTGQVPGLSLYRITNKVGLPDVEQKLVRVLHVGVSN